MALVTAVAWVQSLAWETACHGHSQNKRNQSLQNRVPYKEDCSILELKSPQVQGTIGVPFLPSAGAPFLGSLVKGPHSGHTAGIYPWEGEGAQAEPGSQSQGPHSEKSRLVSFLPLGWLTVDKWMSTLPRDRICNEQCPERGRPPWLPLSPLASLNLFTLTCSQGKWNPTVSILFVRDLGNLRNVLQKHLSLPNAR